jgi:glycosyltransferase involved in cell wall biosynthesis
MNKTKCLFVSHVPLGSIFGGGAGNSLLTFLQHQDFLEVDLILPFFIGRLFHLPKIIRQAFAQKPSTVNKIYFLPLPWSSCFEGRQTSLKANFAYFINNIIAYFVSPLTKTIIGKSEYTFVHFNSVVLHQLISKNSHHILHVREMLDKKSKFLNRTIHDICNASGLIFIDKSTQEDFKKLSSGNLLPRQSIINNPFDMNEARSLRHERKAILQKYGFERFNGKIFAYLGNIHPIKGTDLILKAFTESEIENAKLLIVGTGNIEYIDYCRSIAKDNNDRVIFMGMLEYHEVYKIYAISDFIVRGDPDFRTGRTTYEALYAGCHIIIPGNKKDLRSEPELQTFVDRILFYEPRESKSLVEAIKHAHSLNIESHMSNTPTGNIEKNRNAMKEFLRSIIYAENL